jgi:hypothetical protein
MDDKEWGTCIDWTSSRMKGTVVVFGLSVFLVPIPFVHLSVHQGMYIYTPVPFLLIGETGGMGEGGGVGVVVGGETAEAGAKQLFMLG